MLILSNKLPAWRHLADGVVLDVGPLGTAVLADVGGRPVRQEWRGRWIREPRIWEGERWRQPTLIGVISTAEEHRGVWIETAMEERDYLQAVREKREDRH